MSSSTSSQSSLPASDALRDKILWRRKKQSVLVLLIATATWVLMGVYHFNFITVISWAIMFVVVLLFLWANILKLLGKDPPEVSGLEISEQRAFEMANMIRAWMEEGIRWMFRVSAEREWYVFAGTVAGLGLLSYVGTLNDLLTLIYTGIVMGMTVPVLYMKYEDNIKRHGERVKGQARRFYDKVDEKVVKNIKNRVVVEKEEEEKVE
ncbi:reticulon-like protein B13 [Corylus avellana]|uniref:reticulon-like protein B13 n=1 Tax=Corylus avellana TaxID=13451 RepID=UPI00286CD2F3|nr:reticulon-like protein B13 [Corylus avellana]